MDKRTEAGKKVNRVKGPLGTDPDGVFADPQGMYTGVPDDPHEKPVQDADDL